MILHAHLNEIWQPPNGSWPTHCKILMCLIQTSNECAMEDVSVLVWYCLQNGELFMQIKKAPFVLCRLRHLHSNGFLEWKQNASICALEIRLRTNVADFNYGYLLLYNFVFVVKFFARINVEKINGLTTKRLVKVEVKANLCH